MLSAKVNVKKLSEEAVVPSYGSEYAAGADLYACIEEAVTIAPGETYLVKTGIAMEIPEGYAGLVYARSGLATKQGLRPANCVGVVDTPYRGECIVALHNDSNVTQKVNPNDRIAQLVVTPYYKCQLNEVTELNDTDRGMNGFGSTGKQ